MEVQSVLEITSTIFQLEDGLLQTSIIFGFINTDLSTWKCGFQIGKLQVTFHFEHISNTLRERNSEMLH